MGLDKSDIKLAMLHELGTKFDDLLEGIHVERQRAEGAAAALIQAAKAVTQVATLVDNDVDKDRYDLETATKIKEYVARCAALLDSMALASRNQKMANLGRVEGMSLAVKIIKKEHDSETVKQISMDEAAEEAADIVDRIIGQRPPPTLKQRRQAEADAAPEQAKPVKKKTVSMKDKLAERAAQDDPDANS